MKPIKEITCTKSEMYPRYEYALDPCPIHIFTNACCGVKELHGISGSFKKGTMEKDLLNVVRVIGRVTAFLLFTGVEKDAAPVPGCDCKLCRPTPPVKEPSPLYADHFKALIEEKGLGTVLKSEVRNNPNSKNDIAVYLWALDPPKVAAWIAQEEKEFAQAQVQAPQTEGGGTIS